MATGSTLYTFDIDLADVDRGVYQTLNLRVAQHPSETPDFLLTRVLAYCLEYAEGISFTKGLSDPDEPAIAVRDLTGVLQTWVDIGLPEPARLHRASKAAPQVAVYVHKDPTLWLQRLTEAKIHRAEHLQVQVLDRDWLARLVGLLQRRMQWSLSRSEGQIYLTLGNDTLETAVQRMTLG